MKNIKAKALATSAICTALSVLLVAIAIYVPPLTLIMTVFAGTPMMYLCIRHGIRISVVAMGASILMLFMFTGNILSAVLMGIINLLPGIVAGRSIAKRSNFTVKVIAVSLAVFLGLMLHLIILNVSGGGNGIEKLITSAIDNAKQLAEPVLSTLIESNPEQGQSVYDLWNNALDQVRGMIFLYLPSFIIVTSAILGYIVLMENIFVLYRLRAARVPYLPFNCIWAPRSMCYAVVIMSMITMFSNEVTVFIAAFKNMVALIYAYLAVCGLSLVDYKLSGKIKSGYIRFGIYVAGGVVGYMAISLIYQVLSIVGMIDGVFNFRHLHKAGGDSVGHK